MTPLGAAIYFGFFAAAAVWLSATADRPVEREQFGERLDGDAAAVCWSDPAAAAANASVRPRPGVTV